MIERRAFVSAIDMTIDGTATVTTSNEFEISMGMSLLSGIEHAGRLHASVRVHKALNAAFDLNTWITRGTRIELNFVNNKVHQLDTALIVSSTYTAEQVVIKSPYISGYEYRVTTLENKSALNNKLIPNWLNGFV